MFKVESEGLLLTNSALRRMLFGVRGSLIEGYNNRGPLTKIYDFSLLKQLNDLGIRTSHVRLFQIYFLIQLSGPAQV